MKRFSLAGPVPQLSVGHYALPILVGITAAALGFLIGQGHSAFAAGALLLPLLFLFPVEVAFGMFALLIPFDAVAVLGHAEKGWTLTSLAGVATAAVLLGVGLAARRFNSPSPCTIWWLLFALWYSATSLWALNSDSSLKMLPTLLALLSLYLVSSCFRYTSRELNAIASSLIIGGCIAAIWTLYLFNEGSFYAGGAGSRASLIVDNRYTNPNELGLTLLLPISLSFGYFLVCKRRLTRFTLVLAMTVSILALLSTMSRSAVVALLAMFVVYLHRLRVRLNIVVPLFVLAICLSFMPSGFFTRFQTAGESGGSGRLDIWTVGLTTLQHYGGLGAGLNNFPYAYTNYMGAAPHYRGSYRDAHNIYLAIGVEAGVIGLLLFVVAVRSQFRALVRLKHRSDVYNLLAASEAASCGILVYACFGNTLWTKTFWLSWMLLSATSKLVVEQSRAGHSSLTGPAEEARHGVYG